MGSIVQLSPVTRIEGHLGIRTEVENNVVTAAYCSGEMFRGMETILQGRDPLDAQQIMQRICGLCPVSQGTASILAQDMAFGISPPKNGRLVRNLILAADYLHSNILHFYQLSLIDFIDITAITKYKGTDPQLLDFKTWVLHFMSNSKMVSVPPFMPRYKSRYITDDDYNILAVKHYLQALEARALAHRMGAVFAGKMPHAATLVPGGVIGKITVGKIASYRSMLRQVQKFITTCWLPDLLEVAAAFPDYFKIGRGCGNLMAYGAFPESEDMKQQFFPSGVSFGNSVSTLDISRISEHCASSWYSSPSGLHPAQGTTRSAPDKHGAYSWIKAPRYDGKVMEVGALARVMISYRKKDNPALVQALDQFFTAAGCNSNNMYSVLGRHAARAIESKILADRCDAWLEQLVPGEEASIDFSIPASGRGYGLTEAPRGALGHWLEIRNHKISRYQCVVPTTWNCSPRDDYGVPGPVEQALVGTMLADTDQPIEAARVVRSFDPCLACAVH